MADALPKMNPVRSSNVEAVGYEADKKVMHIKFKGGDHYSYEGVPAELHTTLHSAKSVGKFIHEHIKGKFTHRKH